MASKWKPGDLLIADSTGPLSRTGFTYRGLGLHVEREGDSEIGLYPSWTVTHLDSGHAVCQINGPKPHAVMIATKLAECADWTFTGHRGEKGLAAKVFAILDRYDLTTSRGTGPDGRADVAEQVAKARAT